VGTGGNGKRTKKKNGVKKIAANVGVLDRDTLRALGRKMSGMRESRRGRLKTPVQKRLLDIWG